jgi:hypothetical protein
MPACVTALPESHISFIEFFARLATSASPLRRAGGSAERSRCASLDEASAAS